MLRVLKRSLFVVALVLPACSSDDGPPQRTRPGARDSGTDRLGDVANDRSSNPDTDTGSPDTGSGGAAGDSAVTPDAGSDVTADAGPDVTPEAGPDASADTGSDAIPDAGSDTVADAGPDTSADTGSDTGSDATPDAGTDAGADSADASGTSDVLSSGRLVINEVDYDQIGTDADEYIEIWNSSSLPINLSGIALVLVNGLNSTVYTTVDLSPGGTLAGNQYLIVASATVTVPVGAARFLFSSAMNNIQNGAPDGVALVDTNTNTLIDALSYTGAITMATIPGLGTVSLVEGTLLPATVADSNVAAGSLCRLPNGRDTNNAASDWSFSNTPTPGAPNVP